MNVRTMMEDSILGIHLPCSPFIKVYKPITVLSIFFSIIPIYQYYPYVIPTLPLYNPIMGRCSGFQVSGALHQRKGQVLHLSRHARAQDHQHPTDKHSQNFNNYCYRLFRCRAFSRRALREDATESSPKSRVDSCQTVVSWFKFGN